MDFAATLIAKDMTDFCEKQPQVIRRLRGGSHRGTTRTVAVRARNRDRGRNTVDVLGVRLLESLQELPRVSRETLDVTPLTFGVERVEGQAALAAAAQSAEDDYFLARDVEVDSLEVMDFDAP